MCLTKIDRQARQTIAGLTNFQTSRCFMQSHVATHPLKGDCDLFAGDFRHTHTISREYVYTVVHTPALWIANRGIYLVIGKKRSRKSVRVKVYRRHNSPRGDETNNTTRHFFPLFGSLTISCEWTAGK